MREGEDTVLWACSILMDARLDSFDCYLLWPLVIVGITTY